MKSLTSILKLMLFLSFFGSAEEVTARPQYKKAWDTLYKLRGVKAKCSVCHPAIRKPQLNAYGTALAKELGEKNVKDMRKIMDALKAIEKNFPDSPCPPVPPLHRADY